MAQMKIETPAQRIKRLIIVCKLAATNPAIEFPSTETIALIRKDFPEVFKELRKLIGKHATWVQHFNGIDAAAQFTFPPQERESLAVQFLTSISAIKSEVKKADVIKKEAKKPKKPSEQIPLNIKLFLAVQNNKPDEVAYWLAQGANVDFQDKQGTYPLHMAAQWGLTKVVEKLLVAHPDLNPKLKGNTPLILACEAGKVEVVRQLIAAGCDVTVSNPAQQGFRAIHFAAQANQVEIVKLLLAKGEGNARTATEDTALFIAANHNCLAVVKTLLADPQIDRHAQDFQGARALDFIIDKELPLILAEMLKPEHKINFNFPRGDNGFSINGSFFRR